MPTHKNWNLIETQLTLDCSTWSFSIHRLEFGFLSPGNLGRAISESLGIATETFFWAFTVALLVAAFLGPRVGKAIDRLGGRRVLPFGSIAFILGLSTLAASTSVQMLFAAWVLIGIGAAIGQL